MIFIRTDANKNIATGHVMRCIAIADELKKNGEIVVFVLSDNFSENLINEYGFECIILNTKYDEMENELDEFTQLLKANNVKIVLLDSYFATVKYMSEIKKYVKLAYIDDIGNEVLPVDILINYANYYDKYDYATRYADTDTKLLLGCSYVPLRKEFIDVSKLDKNSVYKDEDGISNIKNILITTGGSDNYHMEYLISKQLLDDEYFKNIKFTLVVGKFNTHKDELVGLQQFFSNISILTDVDNMAEIMNQNDLAVSAGGTTLYELCYMGVPTVCFSFADNQMDGTERFGKDNVMINAGDVRDNPGLYANIILNNVKNLIDFPEYRKMLTDKMKAIVDGNGAERIAKELTK